MEAPGLIDSISTAALRIDLGRKGFATRGKEQESRFSYEEGIAEAMTAFQKAQTAADPQIMLLAEYTFLSQELYFCERTDKDSIASLTKALQDFEFAFRALQAVEEKGYKTSDKTYPDTRKYRVSGFPKDAFHIAAISHRTRIQNILRTPGLDLIEKTLLKQRRDNLTAAQNSYIKMQKKAMAN